jgi:Protein of unknown function (DUF3108)
MVVSRLHRFLSSVLALASVAVLGAASAQSAAPPRHPFGAGEKAEFQVRLGGVSVGSGSLEVVGLEMVGGQQTYHTRMRISGGLRVARVNDRYESWIDTDGLFSRRFVQDIHEVRYRRNRSYEFFPERRSYRRENGETGTLPTEEPLDDLSFIYYARTLPMEVGDEYTLNRYFKADGNPVVLRVLRKETINVPAGRFRTVVVQPVIKTDGLFGEGGRAEVYFSDDERRIPVMIKSRVPVVGSLTMLLRSYTPGQ